jgi:hypothetical protein
MGWRSASAARHADAFEIGERSVFGGEEEITHKRCIEHSQLRATLTPSRLAKEVSLAVSKRSRIKRCIEHPQLRATLTPSRLAKEVSLAVRRKSRIKGASNMSVRTPANNVANRPLSPKRLAVT